MREQQASGEKNRKKSVCKNLLQDFRRRKYLRSSFRHGDNNKNIFQKLDDLV